MLTMFRLQRIEQMIHSYNRHILTIILIHNVVTEFYLFGIPMYHRKDTYSTVQSKSRSATYIHTK